MLLKHTRLPIPPRRVYSAKNSTLTRENTVFPERRVFLGVGVNLASLDVQKNNVLIESLERLRKHQDHMPDGV